MAKSVEGHLIFLTFTHTRTHTHTHTYILSNLANGWSPLQLHKKDTHTHFTWFHHFSQFCLNLSIRPEPLSSNASLVSYHSCSQADLQYNKFSMFTCQWFNMQDVVQLWTCKQRVIPKWSAFQSYTHLFCAVRSRIFDLNQEEHKLSLVILSFWSLKYHLNASSNSSRTCNRGIHTPTFAYRSK